MKNLLKLAFLLLVGILGYNYFFGDVEEKEQSKEIVNKVRDVGRDAWGLLKSEKAKLKEGKYDGAVEKVSSTVTGIGELLGKLSKTAKDLNDSGALDELSKLQQRQSEIQEKLDHQESDEAKEEVSKDLENDLQNLLKETERIMKEMDSENQ